MDKQERLVWLTMCGVCAIAVGRLVSLGTMVGLVIGVLLILNMCATIGLAYILRRQ